MKILVIDDSTFAQKNIIRLLSEEFEDLEIITANDGLEGLELCKKHKPDYTFIDLLMPEMDGTQLIKSLKEGNIETKKIVVSADIQTEVRTEVEDMGIFKFICKPFNREKAKKIAELIREDMNQ
jgi:two-component system, chemotaxis family, chemotaxis protein CheY